MPRLALAAVLAAVLGAAAPARADETEVSGAVAYWSDGAGSANAVTLGRFWNLPGVAIGPRVGLAYVTGPSSAGVPLDLVARIGLPGFYVEGQAGVWLLFARGTVARFHATGGAGFGLGPLRVGAEAGYLASGALIGARVSLGF